MFNSQHLKSLESIFSGVGVSFELELVEFNGEADHVHLLVNFPPKVSVSRLVNSLKGVSSPRLKQMHPEWVKSAYMKNALWSPGYYASSVGRAPIAVIPQYIEQQTKPQ